MYYETNLGTANTYFEITKAFEILEVTGSEPSHCYYGRSQIYVPTYRPLKVRKGGIILNLCGGIFYAEKAGAVCRPVTLAKNEKTPFEKRYYPDMHTWPLANLKPIAPVPYVHA